MSDLERGTELGHQTEQRPEMRVEEASSVPSLKTKGRALRLRWAREQRTCA